jgi:integrase
LHPVLIKLGFIKHVDSLPDDAVRVFPDLKPISSKYSHYPSRWFGVYKKACSITDKKLKFHSFRHGLETNLKHQMINQVLIDEILGHSVQGMKAVYGKKFTPDIQLKKGIKKLDFGIDLKKLL